MNRLFGMVAASLLSAVCYPSIACTSVIISSKASPDGRPLLWKHRDSGEQDCRIGHFRGEHYSFIGLENSSSEGGEVWAGVNTEGFSIINTASYNLKDDDVDVSLMDREGMLMYDALGLCRTIADFEEFLDSRVRPMGVEANFGVIDAYGGASYYEVDNSSYVKYDVNDIPEGYMVVTNFSFSGREEDRKGYERYVTASDIFSEAFCSGVQVTPDYIFDNLSRRFRNDILGIDYTEDYRQALSSGFFNGIAVDQDFIPRRITSSSVVVQGVAEGEDPCFTVMWTLLGYPLCSVAIPLMASEGDNIPFYMKGSGVTGKSMMCNSSLYIKDRYVFRFHGSNGASYLDLKSVYEGVTGHPPLKDCWEEAESAIENDFYGIYLKWRDGALSDREFFRQYERYSARFWDIYLKCFSSFLY